MITILILGLLACTPLTGDTAGYSCEMAEAAMDECEAVAEAEILTVCDYGYSTEILQCLETEFTRSARDGTCANGEVEVLVQRLEGCTGTGGNDTSGGTDTGYGY